LFASTFTSIIVALSQSLITYLIKIQANLINVLLHHHRIIRLKGIRQNRTIIVWDRVLCQSIEQFVLNSKRCLTEEYLRS